MKEMMMVKAIVFGATGMVGEGVLHVALNHPDVESVLVIGRRSCEVHHPKLKEIIHTDFFNYATLQDRLVGYNACFFCLGVSSVGMKEPEYTRVTYDLTMEAARTLSTHNPDMTFCYVSGAGTDGTERGRLMWARVKGRTENHLAALPFKAVYLFRPGFIKPIPGLKRAYAAATAIGWLYPLWKFLLPKYLCRLDELGRAMVHVAEHGPEQHILENLDISRLGSEDSSRAV